jgi:prepilin signal peptidase PulO-like enzyme (type II secretory pathway)
MTFLQNHGFAVFAAVMAAPLAGVAKYGARRLTKQIHAELAVKPPCDPMIGLPIRMLRRLFVVWLTINAVWLAEQPSVTFIECLGSIGLLSVLGMLALIDAETGILPNELILLFILLAFAYSRATSGIWMPRLDLLWGMALGYIVPMLFNGLYRAVAQREALGQGDAKLLAAIGLWLGARALVDVWLIACAVLLVYTAGRKLGCQTALHLKMGIPFGPFLVIAANAIVIHESF